MDVLRAALGQSRLTYLGKSYGTYLGTWYAQLFPHRVRALVLDGAVDPDTTGLQADITQAEGFTVAFRSFAAWCLAAAGCPLGEGVSPGSVNTAAARLAGHDRSGQFSCRWPAGSAPVRWPTAPCC